MSILSARRLSKAYGPQTLFSDVAITIEAGERVGLLGINGTGKSTLLRVLAGVEPADEGVVDRRRDASILYLAQEPELDPDKTPRTIVEEGLAEWKTATKRHEEISRRIEAGEAADALVVEQSALGERIEQLGGWARGHVAEDMLDRVGIRELDRPVATMSGGERRRVALARVLVARPALAILDEPTNHLDTSTIDWLETYLTTEYEGAILMVTHDRYALDAVCDRIIELDRGGIAETQGGYGDYLEQKAARLAHEERAGANRANLLRRETAWLSRGAQARSTKQKARIKRAEALIAAEPIKTPDNVNLGGLESGAAELGKSVLDFENIDLGVGGKSLIKDFTLHLVAGDRVGIIGPNGAGKTSLLRAVTGELEPTRGKVVRGARTQIALFDQARAQLRDDWSILDNVAEREGADRSGAGVVHFGKETLEVRAYLELFLFDPSKQRQKVGALSGGERARVALAQVLKSGANLLLLDEPTNDLDVATLSALEELLVSWPGCLLAVSHDRYFLDRVATSILSFEPSGRVVRYPGNYSTYLSLRPKPGSIPPPTAMAPALKATKPTKSALSYAERTELDGIMTTIDAAEQRVKSLEQDLTLARGDDVKRLTADHAAATAEVARLLARWESLESRRGRSPSG